MKKLFLLFLFMIGLISCTNDMLMSEKETLTNLDSTKRMATDDPCRYFSSYSQSTILPNVKATYLDNGISTNCQNNILIFSTLNDYENSILALDEQIDQHNDYFDSITYNMSDDEADAYADETGFNEDQPLDDFENNLSFCSLRNHINVLEENWLNAQGDGNWNLDTQPDGYFIDDETERTLLSVGSEFIVGNCKIGYTLYKRFEWGYISFPITSISDASQILTTLNNNDNPTIQPLNQNGLSIEQVQEIVSTVTTDTPIDIVPVVDYSAQGNQGGSSSYGLCKSEIKNKGQQNFSSSKRIIWKHKYKDTHYPNLTGMTMEKSYTRSYKKKNGKWKTFRATIFTGMKGDYYYGNSCNFANNLAEHGKERRRKKVKERHIELEDYSVRDDSYFSVHKQEGNYFQVKIWK